MYNGVGLKTPRGSGTNGYVQKNMSFMARSKEKVDYLKPEELEKQERSSTDRHGNPEILEHERRHRVEVKCLELRDMMEDEGYSEEIVNEKIKKFRQALLERESLRIFGKRKLDSAASSHELNEALRIRNKRLRDALGINEENTKTEATKEEKSSEE